jgi:hypothetical protein
MIGAATYWITFGQITTTFFNKPINQFLVMRVGALIGTIVDNFTVPLDSKKSHIIPLGVILIMPGIIATGLFFLPDSPRWLLQTNKEDEARTALKCLPPYPELVDGELVNMELAIDTEAELARSAEIVDLWRDPIDRRRALLAIGTISLQPASGASYIIGERKLGILCGHVADDSSLQHLLLRNGRPWFPVPKYLYHVRYRLIRSGSKQPDNHKIRTIQSIPKLGNGVLWLIAADYGCCVHCALRDNLDWKSKALS